MSLHYCIHNSTHDPAEMCHKCYREYVARSEDESLRNLAARESSATRVEPKPEPNHHPQVADLVIADIVGRREFGLKKYGTALQPHNGRDALTDAYQEALDLCKYLRQAIYERDGK